MFSKGIISDFLLFKGFKQTSNRKRFEWILRYPIVLIWAVGVSLYKLFKKK